MMKEWNQWVKSILEDYTDPLDEQLPIFGLEKMGLKMIKS